LWCGNKNQPSSGKLRPEANTQWPLSFELRAAIDYSDYIHAVIPIPELFEKLPEKSENGNLDAVYRSNQFQ